MLAFSTGFLPIQHNVDPRIPLAKLHAAAKDPFFALGEAGLIEMLE
jgi:hypothetical protein